MIHWCVAKLIYFFLWTEYQYWNNISLYYEVKIWQTKKALYLSVNVFSMKVLIGDTIFTSPTGDGTTILRGHLSHAKV